MGEEYKPRNYKKALIWVSVVAGFIILVMGLMIHSLNNSVSYYSENYQYVPEGKTSFYCESGQQYLCYDNNYYAIAYDPKTESVAQCNLLKDEQAGCINQNQQFTFCQSSQIPVCIDEDQSWTACSTGSRATCLDKSKSATWDGNYASPCPVGQSATCIDYSRWTICEK